MLRTRRVPFLESLNLALERFVLFAFMDGHVLFVDSVVTLRSMQTFPLLFEHHAYLNLLGVAKHRLASRASTSAAVSAFHLLGFRIGTTLLPPVSGCAQYAAQSSISRRRLSKKSVRWYARSTWLPTV